ncbi:MAG: hypothetical protein GY856_14570 [bacterium]|nr:hypothetical protein [bacterium]
MDAEEILRGAILAEADEARQRLGTHPSPDQLLAYQEGELAAEDQEGVQDHVALCRDCARVVLDLESFPDVEPVREDDRVSDWQVAAEWRRLEARDEISPPVKSSPRRSWPMLFSPGFAYAMAASILMAALGLGSWVIQLRGRIDDLSQPRVNVFLSDLIPQKAGLERGPGDAIRVPAWTDRVLLLLNLADIRSFSGYFVEISDRDGRTLWSNREIRRSPDGNFTVGVHRRFLPAGRYRIALYGLEGEARTLVATYTMDIEYE